MKKNQILVATLCASALVLSACTFGPRKPKKKKSSSQDVPTSVVPGPTSSGTPTSSSGTPAPTPSSSGTPTPTPSSSGTPTPTPSSSSGTPAPVVSSIAVTTAPTKTVYTAGESFDPAGMVVTATYSGGSTADVTAQCQFSPSVLTENTAAVTITFGGQSTTQAVTVNAPVVETWSNEEKAIFASELYGYEIPYFTGHHSEMTLKAMSDGGVSYSGGTSSAALIQEYAALVPASFGMQRSTNEKIYAYVGEAEITVENEKRHVQIAVFGVTTSSSGSSISADGSGTFTVQAFDPYYYDWSEFKHDTDLVASIFASLGTAVWRSGDLIEVEVPELTGEGIYYEWSFDNFEDFYKYQIYNELWAEPIAEASIEIAAFCTQDQYNEYLENLDTLTDAWEYVGSYNNGYYLVNVYNSLLGKASIEVGYFASAEIAFIDVCASSSDAFPSKQVLDYIALDREDPQPFPVLDVKEGSYYVNEFDGSIYVDVYVYDDEDFTQASVDAYVEGLDPAKFSYEKIENESSGLEDLFALRADEEEEEEEEDPGYYYFVKDLEYKYTFFVEYTETELSDGTIEKMVEWQVQYEVEHLSEFPSADVDKFYSDAEITAPATPSYSAAGESHYFQEFSGESGIEIDAFGTSESEMLAYIAALSSAGYVGEVDEEGKPVFVEGEYVMEVPSEETHAKVTIENALEEKGYVGILFEPGYVDWTQAQKDKFMKDLGAIPPFIKGLQDYIGTQYDMYYAELEESYAAEVIAAFESDVAWTKQSASVFTATSELGYAQAVFNSDYLEEDGVIYLSITFEQTKWDKEDSDDLAAGLHGIIPPYIRLGLYRKDPSTAYYEGNGVFGSDYVAVYETALEDDGWKKQTEGDSYFYWKASADGEGYAKAWWDPWGDGVSIMYTYVTGDTPGGDVPPTPGESVTASRTITQVRADEGKDWVTNTELEDGTSFAIDSNISVTVHGTARYLDANSSTAETIRLYAKDGEAATATGNIVISAAAGYVIESVTITFKTANDGVLTFGGETVTSGTAVEVNAASATFTAKDVTTTDTKSGNVQILSISVTYAPASN